MEDIKARSLEGTVWATYAVTCGICFTDEGLEGATQAEAIKDARTKGWGVAAPGHIAPGNINVAGKWLCPECNPVAPERTRLPLKERHSPPSVGYLDFRRKDTF